MHTVWRKPPDNVLVVSLSSSVYVDANPPVRVVLCHSVMILIEVKHLDQLDSIGRATYLMYKTDAM